MTAVLALSIGSKVDHYGALAGVAAIVGIGVLAVLYAAQAREVKRLREWAGRAPERDADLQQRVVAEAQRRAAVPAPVQPVARTQPATAAGSPAVAAPPGAGGTHLPGPATPAAVPAAAAAAAAAGAVTAPAAAQAAGTAAPAQKPPVGAPAAPAASPGVPAPGSGPAKPASPVPPATPVVVGAAAGATAAKPAGGAPPGGTPPAVTPTSTAGPTAPAAPPSTPAQPPTPAATTPATPAAVSQPTAVVPPAAPPRPRASAAAPLRTTAREAAAAAPPPGHARRNLAVVIFGGIAIAAIAVLLITQVFNGGDAGPEPKPNTVAAPGQTTGAETTEGGSLPPIDRAATTVSVLNGTAVQGLARGASTKLTTRGYTEGIVKTNTNQQVPTTTVYYVRGSNRQARDVARILGLGAGVVKAMDPAVQTLAGNAPVVVVVGLDQAQ